MSTFRHGSGRRKPAADTGSTWTPIGPGAVSPINPEPALDATSRVLTDVHVSDQDPPPHEGRKGPRSSIIKRFTSSWSQRYPDIEAHEDSSPDEPEGTNGPFGLRLLHSSPEPLVDIVLVHGLRGGSVKTWKRGKHPRFFWPQNWLPLEPGFDNVNIHTFGYESDWTDTKPSILNVHDFGRSLLEEMRNSPYIRSNKKGPILLLGHSMGGLVIKKAFILSQDVEEFNDRIRCIFFLGTPHQGADYAAILNKILTFSGVLSPRDYIQDLTTRSTSAELINVEFGKYAHELPIFTFFETLKISLGFGISTSLIVDKRSAVLGPGYRNERVQYLNADHRDLVRFSSPEDPNYITLKNALMGAIHDLLAGVSTSRNEDFLEQRKILRSYLAILDKPHEQYTKVDGSCQWIDEREDFRDWRDSVNDFNDLGLNDQRKRDMLVPSIVWVHADPGTGKTVLAAHVISKLQELKLECAYYYFHAGNKMASSLGECLRSLAFQMALSNAAIREVLLQAWADGSTFDPDDATTIWNKIFVKGIFQSRVFVSQFWVIDALDECAKYQEFFTIVRGAQPRFPLRIFITSRNVPDMAQLTRPLSTSLVSFGIPPENSRRDIEFYINSRISNLNADVDKDEIARTILRRSNASFLWVRLVLDKLEKVYSLDSVMLVLESIPEGMIPFYERTIKDMAENGLEKHIAKAVLLWVVSSTRRITISELTQALRLDENIVLPDAAVEGLCGQLIKVDKATGIVDVIHATVHEFLLKDIAGYFKITRSEAHLRIALICLKLLCSNEMRPPRGRRFVGQARPEDPSPLLDYALTQFSEHVYVATSGNDNLLIAVDRFFQTNVLTWVERIAMKGDLHRLIRTTKNLKAYLERRAKYHSPLNKEVINIGAWSVDLSRLVTKFGAALLQNPSSIHFLIPPLCPIDSAIYTQFGKRHDGLTVVGFKSRTWDDCIASVGFGEQRPMSVSCGWNLIAVGMSSGEVSFFNHQSCQKEGGVRSKFPVEMVHFTQRRIAVCTIRSISLHDLHGNTLWEQRLRFRCILLTSLGDGLYAVTQHGQVLKWSLSTGELESDQLFEFQNHGEETSYNRLPVRAPMVVSLSPDMEMIALGYRGGTICLWDMPNHDFINWALDDEDKIPTHMIFNPNYNINLLLVIYQNHQFSLYDTWDGTRVKSHTPEASGVLSASCSPDGRSFATADTRGNLQIWDFESLSLLYNLASPYSPRRLIEFTSDGSSLVDVTHSGMRIWSPSVLIRKDIEEDASTSEGAPSLNTTHAHYEPLMSSKVTALCAHPVHPLVFAGKQNGKVIAFSAKSGKQLVVLYEHPGRDRVNKLVASRSGLLASGDSNGVIQVWKLTDEQTGKPRAGSMLLQLQERAVVQQMCFSGLDHYLLVSTVMSDRVYLMRSGRLVGSMRIEQHDRSRTWRWLGMPPHVSGGDERFALVTTRSLKVFGAANFPDDITGPTRTFDAVLDAPESQQLSQESSPGRADGETIELAAVHAKTQTLVLSLRRESHKTSPSSTTYLFDISSSGKASPPTGQEAPLLFKLSPEICEHFIGVIDSQPQPFFFLHRNSWLSSFDLASLARNSYTRSFFVPNDYLAGNHEAHAHEVRPIATADANIVFCVYGELVIVRNGLKFQESKSLEIGTNVDTT